MELFIFLLLIFAIVGFFALAGILFSLTKLFKIKNFTYKKSVKILFFLNITGFIIGATSKIIDFELFFEFLYIVATFFILFYFLKKYYQVNWKRSLAIYISFFIIVPVLSLFIILPARSYIVSPFVIKGEAMSPTLNNGDWLLVKKFNNNEFSRGDIIIFQNSQNKTFYIQRIIGLPWEKIEIYNGQVIVDGQILNEAYTIGQTNKNISIMLDNNQYFALGDNRDESTTSNPIQKENIVGKVIFNMK